MSNVCYLSTECWRSIRLKDDECVLRLSMYAYTVPTSLNQNVRLKDVCTTLRTIWYVMVSIIFKWKIVLTSPISTRQRKFDLIPDLKIFQGTTENVSCACQCTVTLIHCRVFFNYYTDKHLEFTNVICLNQNCTKIQLLVHQLM